MNVSNGRLSSEKVNVHMAMDISLKQVMEFQKSLPGGFWSPIAKEIKTMSETKRATKISNQSQKCNPVLIYSRALALQVTLILEPHFAHELAPLSLSIFDDS